VVWRVVRLGDVLVGCFRNDMYLRLGVPVLVSLCICMFVCVKGREGAQERD
jgi:hypothetical protein